MALPQFDEIFYYFFDHKYGEFTIIFGTTGKDVFMANYQIIKGYEKWNLLKMKKLNSQLSNILS